VFYHYTDTDALIVTIDVDDFTMAGNTKHVMTMFKRELSGHYKIKDLGKLKWLLGIEVKRIREEQSVTLLQKAYIEWILTQFNLQDAKPVSMPLDPQHKLDTSPCPATPHQLDDMCDVPYREAIGSLMYTALGTCLDIAFAVSHLSQFMQNPGRLHWEAVKRVFCYLKGKKDHILKSCSPGEQGLQGYCDADWASQHHRHSISGYVFMVDGGTVSWSSKRQPIVALSTTEAEYIAVTHATKEAVWIHTFIAEIA